MLTDIVDLGSVVSVGILAREVTPSAAGPQAGKPTSLTGYKLLWYRNL